MNVEVRDAAGWRRWARYLRERNIPPDEVWWQSAATAQSVLPFVGGDDGEPPEVAEDRRRVPRAFLGLADTVACHRDDRRWDLLYRLLWRLDREGRMLLQLETDSDVRAAKDLAAQVRRDEHKMRAFVRFSPVDDAPGERYVAYYEPDHLIVRRAAPFFADRFAAMRWSILTPDLCAHWDGAELTFSDGVPRPLLPAGGEIEELWRAYYTAVYNPARVNLRATLREMPLRRWRGLPEASLIPALVGSAHERTMHVLGTRSEGSARPFLPESRALPDLRAAAGSCQGCALHERATQVVFGEGPPDARLVLVGEQPGDAEDLSGRPFVGPAGQVLDRALAAAGIPRSSVYLTNAVKHFSFEPRGKRRIHQTPRLSELRACRPWLEAELQAIRPAAVVCLGSSAARALLGPQARVMALRGRVIDGTSWAERLVVTVHPSAVLRGEDAAAEYYAMLVADLALAMDAR